jgi:Glycosyltransferase sugar-binding region containing DXD motif
MHYPITNGDESLLSVASRPEVRLFWTGPPLGPYEELSLRSFVAGGARVLLYATNKDLAVPEGVELVDAREILSGQVHHFTFADGVRSPALHSDLFRYLAIQQFGGWYADLDIILVGKKMPDSKVYIARESDHLVNSAVMTFPAGSPFMDAAIDEAWKLLPEAGPGAPLSKRISIGPQLVTQLAHDYALDHLIRPQSSAYEIMSAEIPLMFDPGQREELEERVANSDFVHLWNEVWRWVRIPKNFGPPVGSFLDGLFRRVGMTFADDVRLSAESVAVWFRERHVLEDLRWRLGTEVTPPNALDLLIERDRASRSAAISFRPAERRPAAVRARPVRAAVAPQTLRTFWHGGPIGPYQLLCLRSLVDRGHRVEVFSFEPIPELPDWLVRENAGDIVPSERVLRYLPDQRRFAIHADLFRHAVLHRMGGWWIDPDVVLLRTELPTGEMFFAGPNEFNVMSTAALKFPAGHPALIDALVHTTSFEDSVNDWGQAGASLLTQSIVSNSLFDARWPIELVNPVKWFDVLRVFDPSQADSLSTELDGKHFLDLHMDAWLGAGIPNFLAPPRGSFLDRLFERHDFRLVFPARMEFDDVSRWLTNMYECTYPQRA